MQTDQQIQTGLEHIVGIVSKAVVEEIVTRWGRRRFRRLDCQHTPVLERVWSR